MSRWKRYNAWVERNELWMNCVFLPINTAGVISGIYLEYDKLVVCSSLYAGYSMFVLIKHWRIRRAARKNSVEM